MIHRALLNDPSDSAVYSYFLTLYYLVLSGKSETL